MKATDFAVVPRKGKDDAFTIIDADASAGSIRHMSGELTTEQVRAVLRERGHSDIEIDRILAKAVADGPMA
jgi:hypothetical protein